MIITLFLDVDNNRWKFLFDSIIILWICIASLLCTVEIYNRIIFFSKFKTFKGGGVFSDEKFILNLLLVALSTASIIARSKT
jgi:hypothetical protein